MSGTVNGSDITEPKPDKFIDRFLVDSMLPRILVRTAECVLLSKIEFHHPILDIGSGDGTFVKALFDEPVVDVGIDPQRQPMLFSRKLGTYRYLTQAVGDRLPFKDETFASVMSNSTLEHIPDPEAVLKELHRVARPRATCVVTVPSEYFPRYLLGSTILNGLRLRKGAELYGSLFNRISRHVHIEPATTWIQWLESAGFEVLAWRYYFSHRNSLVFDLSHYLCIPSLLTRALLGRWVLWLGKAGYLPYRRLLALFSTPGDNNRGAYVLFQCRKA